MRAPRATGRPGGTTWGTNGGLGGDVHTWRCLRGGAVSQGRRTPDGGRTEFPGFICSFFSFICFRNTWGQGVDLSFLPIGKFKCLNPPSPGDYRQLNISYLEPTGRGGFTAGGLSFERCRQTPRRLSDPRHLDWTSHHPPILDCSSSPIPPTPPPPTQHPPAPRSGLPAVGVCGGCASIVSVNSRTIHPHNACSPNSGKHIPWLLPTHTHS